MEDTEAVPVTYLISCLLINCIVRIWNLHGSVDFGLKRKIFKNINRTLPNSGNVAWVCYQGIQCVRRKSLSWL